MASAPFAAHSAIGERARSVRTRPRAELIAAALIIVAIGLRLATLLVPHFFFADEIFQYFEPAHRLVFGDGVVTWEQRYHVRSWAFPLALAGPMWLGGTIAPGTTAYLLAPKLALIALSLASLWSAARLGQRISPLHGMFGLLVAAIWFEGIYFSSEALTEAAAVPLFLAGAALAYQDDRRSLISAGLLLAAAALVRFQYAPSIILFGLIGTRLDSRRAGWLVIGATGAVAISAAIDLATGGVPFDWLIENIRQNILLGRARAFSTAGPAFYPLTVMTLLGAWSVPILGLSLIGAKRYPALAVCATVNLAIHCAIAHKEYRFVLLTSEIVVVLAAIGSGDALVWLRRRLPGARLSRLGMAGGAAWLLASAALAYGPVARLWWRQGTPMLQVFDILRQAPYLCGVALHGVDWSASGGYTYLHRSVPLFVYSAGQDRLLARERVAFDAIVARAPLPLPTGFVRSACFADTPGAPALCLSRRRGTCDPAAASTEINRYLARQGR